MLKAKIDADLKTAMLSGDKRLVSILRSIKSAILYKEVAENKRDSGLSDDEIINVLKKEQKSRRDALMLYSEAGEEARADEENYQINVITSYLPAAASESQILEAIKKAMKELGINDIEQRNMGLLIGTVRKSLPNAEGSLIADAVKKVINKEA